jgi:hypothetical protein
VSETGYIYGLLCLLDNKVRYVGRTLEPARRFKQHVSESLGAHSHHDTPKVRWINDLDQQGLRPQLVILETLEDLEFEWASYGRHPDPTAAELRWTKRLLAEGHPIVNHEKRLAEIHNADSPLLDDALERGRQMFG